MLKLGRKHKTSINLHIVRKLRSSFEIEIVFTHVRALKHTNAHTFMNLERHIHGWYFETVHVVYYHH